MSIRKLHRVILFALMCMAVAVSFAQRGQAQTSTPATRPADVVREDDTNLDIHLYLILATNREVEEGKMPAALEPLMKGLRESFNFKHYSLAATVLNRVRNNGRLDVSWVGVPLLAPVSSSTGNPSFNNFSAIVKLNPEDTNRAVVRMLDFRFGSRVPIVTANTPNIASAAPSAVSVINYESIGLRTDISMREGVPVIAGTLNVPSGDAIVIVIAARRLVN